MKKNNFLILIFSIVFSINSFAQENLSLEKKRNKSIYIELLGASNLIGISYDARFSSSSPWGYRVGISYYQGGNKNQKPNRGVLFPIEINHLIGRNKHKFEIGLGASMGVYNESPNLLYTPSADGTNNELKVTKSKSISHFAYFLFSNIGYRYLSNRGFLFRTGLNPSFSFKDKHGITRKPFVVPYISLGYSF